jgi:hypothetical protein
MDEDTTYKIKRFRFQQGSEVIETGLTHGDGWFDGYEEE